MGILFKLLSLQVKYDITCSYCAAFKCTFGCKLLTMFPGLVSNLYSKLGWHSKCHCSCNSPSEIWGKLVYSDDSFKMVLPQEAINAAISADVRHNGATFSSHELANKQTKNNPLLITKQLCLTTAKNSWIQIFFPADTQALYRTFICKLLPWGNKDATLGKSVLRPIL